MIRLDRLRVDVHNHESGAGRPFMEAADAFAAGIDGIKDGLSIFTKSTAGLGEANVLPGAIEELCTEGILERVDLEGERDWLMSRSRADLL
jgi:hypothetical protein